MTFSWLSKHLGPNSGLLRPEKSKDEFRDVSGPTGTMNKRKKLLKLWPGLGPTVIMAGIQVINATYRWHFLSVLLDVRQCSVDWQSTSGYQSVQNHPMTREPEMTSLNWWNCQPTFHCAASLSSACSPIYLSSLVKDSHVIKRCVIRILFSHDLRK